MIFVRDKGQMCNNILQYAHLYAWGREEGIPTVSMRFSYKYQYFKICSTPRHNFFTYLAAKWTAALHLIPTVTFTKQTDIEQAQRTMRSHKFVLAQGWDVLFPDLFLKYKSEILDLFSFNEEIPAKVSPMMEAAAPDGTLRLGVHIRRGDYARWNGGKYLFPDDVFAAYINAVKKMHPGRKVVVFLSTNDPAVDVGQFRLILGDENVFKFDGNPAEDLCMLSMCDCLIGPPSTFSLVAAMFRDIPLCWMMTPQPADSLDFKKFDQLFTHIL